MPNCDCVSITPNNKFIAVSSDFNTLFLNSGIYGYYTTIP